MRVVIFLVASLLAGEARTAPVAVKPLAEDAAAFGTRAAAEQLSMSPTGRKVVILVAGPGGLTSAQVFDLVSGGSSIPVSSNGTDNVLRWCKFGSETVLVCKYGGIVDDPAYGLISYSRLIRVDVDGKNLKQLGQRQSFYDANIRQFDGAIIDWLPGSGGAVLMARDYVPEEGRSDTRIMRKQNGLAVDRIDLESLKSESVERPTTGVGGYMTDGIGHVRLRFKDESATGTGQMTGRTRLSYRAQGNADWKPLGIYDEKSGDSMTPLAIEAQSDKLYFLRKLNGRQALYRMPLNGSSEAELVAKNDAVDIDNVTRIGRGQKVIGYTYAEDDRHAVYFDPEFESLASKLGRAIPNQPLIDFVDASEDGNILVVYAGSDVHPGTYYFLDRKTKEMSPIVDVRPGIAERTLSPMKSIRYGARDGASIPAYLTVPAGTSGKNLPAVVLPHGGPSSRDEWGFDWLAQFLAARGYAVIQPNYRGSEGFGDLFENENGFKNWETSIADVNDAIKYLVAEGIADPKRLAAVGWSYGGYAALQSAATEPALYKAIIAIAPVTDLALLKSQSESYTNSDLVKEFVGSGDHIRLGSPLRNAVAIKAPVLLVHGDLDINVGIAHSLQMESALKANGTPVELLRYPQLDHQLVDSNARIQMLTKMGELLGRTIGN